MKFWVLLSSRIVGPLAVNYLCFQFVQYGNGTQTLVTAVSTDRFNWKCLQTDLLRTMDGLFCDRKNDFRAGNICKSLSKAGNTDIVGVSCCDTTTDDTWLNSHRIPAKTPGAECIWKSVHKSSVQLIQCLRAGYSCFACLPDILFLSTLGYVSSSLQWHFSLHLSGLLKTLCYKCPFQMLHTYTQGLV